MKKQKLCAALFLLAVLANGCGAAQTPVLEEFAEMPPANQTEAAVATVADYPHYGSFEAAMQASDATVRAVAGETLGMLEQACGPEMSATTEYTVTNFTVLETLWGDLQVGDSFDLYQVGPALGAMAYTSGASLDFAEGEEFVLCLLISENGRCQLLTPCEGAYVEGDCGVQERRYNYLPYTNPHLAEVFSAGEAELELELASLADEIIEFEIVDIQGSFPIDNSGGGRADVSLAE